MKIVYSLFEWKTGHRHRGHSVWAATRIGNRSFSPTWGFVKLFFFSLVLLCWRISSSINKKLVVVRHKNPKGKVRYASWHFLQVGLNLVIYSLFPQGKFFSTCYEMDEQFLFFFTESVNSPGVLTLAFHWEYPPDFNSLRLQFKLACQRGPFLAQEVNPGQVRSQFSFNLRQ